MADAPPELGERVLDVACGTGVVARLAAEKVGDSGRVVGVDLNPGMLSIAGSIASPVEWHEADVTKLGFPSGTFDLALCQQGLQFFPDKRVALKEIRRVLSPRGRFAASVWRPIERSPGFLALAGALARHVSTEASDLARLPFSLSDETALRRLLEGSGFQKSTIRSATKIIHFPNVEGFVQRYVAGSPLASLVGRASDLERQELVVDVAAQLKISPGSSQLSFPIESHIAVALV